MTELNTKTIALIYKMFTTYMRIKYASRRIAVKVKEDVYSKGVYYWELPVLKQSRCSLIHISVTKRGNLEIWSK